MADADHSAKDQLRCQCRKPLEVGQARRIDREHGCSRSAEGGDRPLAVPARICSATQADYVLWHLIDVREQAGKQIGVVGRQEGRGDEAANCSRHARERSAASNGANPSSIAEGMSITPSSATTAAASSGRCTATSDRDRRSEAVANEHGVGQSQLIAERGDVVCERRDRRRASSSGTFTLAVPGQVDAD
jgi:hypothetical protein